MKYVWTPDRDRILSDLYLRGTPYRHDYLENGNVNSIRRLAMSWALPIKTLRFRAAQLGLTRVKEKPWSNEELKVLERNAHRPPAFIGRELKAVGFHRTVWAIFAKRRRLFTADSEWRRRRNEA